MLDTTVEAGLTSLSKVINRLQSERAADSYISYTKPARVEPITLIDSEVLYSPILPDTMQTLLSMFTAYYLQAFSLSINIGSINVVGHLDKLNPNRIGVDELPVGDLTRFGIGAESASYSFKLPSFAMEAIEDAKYIIDPDKKSTYSSIKDPAKTITEAANLAVGKIVNVEFQEGERKASIPISIRLMANTIPSENLAHILTSASRKDTSFMERWHGWRSGRLEFVRDLILCQDLIDAHKKNLVQDKSGVYQHILARRTKNAVASILSGQPSVGSASNLCVVSTATARKMEDALMGSLNKYQIRQKLFEETYLMILAVVDQEWDRVTFYFRGIPEATTVGARELKSSGKDGGTDIMAILNAFREGKSLAL